MLRQSTKSLNSAFFLWKSLTQTRKPKNNQPLFKSGNTLQTLNFLKQAETDLCSQLAKVDSQIEEELQNMNETQRYLRTKVKLAIRKQRIPMVHLMLKHILDKYARKPLLLTAFNRFRLKTALFGIWQLYRRQFQSLINKEGSHFTIERTKQKVYGVKKRAAGLMVESGERESDGCGQRYREVKEKIGVLMGKKERKPYQQVSYQQIIRAVVRIQRAFRKRYYAKEY
ncbi:hypothetical protein FGO68_gene6547 [Halteria grandinella]|uniref:Uncharacterized protein n=1 Tax=Halteria grandinella TaxID=5974 RepID=A0A8J8SWQ1_HALGN|nr:hypothetical protein FGO68_gene6547 [Halteria grandinella]